MAFVNSAVMGAFVDMKWNRSLRHDEITVQYSVMLDGIEQAVINRDRDFIQHKGNHL